MVQIFQTGPSRKGQLAEILGQSLGQGLGEFTGSFFANRALDKVLNDKSLSKSPVSERLSAMESALRPFGERGSNMLQKRLGIEQQRAQEQEQQTLGNVLAGKEIKPEEFSKLSPESQLKSYEFKKKKQFGQNINEALSKAGYPKETAELWQQQFEASPVGGQTDVIKQVNDLIRRSQSGKGAQEQEKQDVIKPSIEIPGIENKAYELDFPGLKEPVGRTPSDIVKYESENTKINNPLYASTIDTLNSLDEDFRSLAQLQEYNEIPGVLPEGREKWNVDWNTGDLRFKALANPETQAYVKNISRMLNRAKEFFPGRVTNFDLEQFKQQFPTLANSPEGRRLIVQQLSLANRIAYLREETLKAAIDHYGAGADPIQIRKVAQENYRNLKGKLEGELKELNKQSDERFKSNREESDSEQKASPGHVLMRYKGQIGEVPENEMEKALKEGAERI